MDNAKIYLCKADSSILGTLTGIQAQTCNLKRNATDLWKLTFDVNRYIDTDGKPVQSDYYDSLDNMMRMYLDGADMQAFFVIDSDPVIKGDGYQETKSVTAHSIECELCNIYLKNFKINCGTTDSQEYLACDTDADGNQNYYNVDPYTGLPYNYITLVNYNNPQLSLLHLALQGTGWRVKEGLDEDICQIKNSFETSDNIYSFFMKTVSPAASVIFEFDRKHKIVGIVKADDYGEDTGVFITMRNLMNSFEVTGTSNDSIVTKFIPTGANNLGIESVNFGKDYILNLDYFMDTRNEYGDYKFVSKELHDQYNRWKDFREKDQISVSINYKDDAKKNITETIKGTRREIYTELTKLYNQTLSDISELKNRVPNDGCMIDYKTYPLDELKTAYTAYNNALLALTTIYRNEYGVEMIGDAPDYKSTPEGTKNIKETPYWHDFYAYKESIIPQIEEALKMYCKTGEHGELLFDEHNGTLIELEFGNPAYYANENIVKEIDSYLYEWSLYGLDELVAKKKAWSEAANLLFDECFIVSNDSNTPDTSTIVYRTPDENGWNLLSPELKSQFTSMTAYIDKLNQYLDYMSFDERDNALTKTKCKGIIRQCEDEIVKRLAEISKIETKQKEYAKKRAEIANSVALETTNNPFFTFTEKDINIINGLIREQEFCNENIITTNLDSIVTTVDIQKELYQSAVEKLYELSQPQYSFKTELDNLYALDAFKAYQKPFDVGNFIRVGLEIHEELCENRFIKLRVISISHNPLYADENLSVEFSTMTKSLNGVNDLAFLLNNQTSGGGTSSSSASGGGTFGNNNADVQISNNMLNALLGTELFGTAVSDVMLDTMKANKGNFNTLVSNSGFFDALETGKLKVSGDCLFDGAIQSSNYSSTQNEDGEIVETGSTLDLSNGTFSLAGGKLKWDASKLYIGGEITATEGITETEFNGNFFTVNNDGFVLKDIRYSNTALNNKSISCATSSDIDRIYLYGHMDYTDEETFSLFVMENLTCKIWYSNDSMPQEEYLDNVIYQYIFHKSDIKSIIPLTPEDTNALDGLSEYVPLYKIGYVTMKDLTLQKNNLEQRLEAVCPSDTCINGYTIIHNSKTTLRTITPTKTDSEYDWYDAYEAVSIIAASFDDGTCAQLHIDFSNRMMINSYHKKIKINNTYMTDQGFSSKYMYDNVTVSGKPLYISSDGTIGLSGSSKRFKNSISTSLTEISDPHGLYDIDIVQYKYNDDYFSSSYDEGIGTYFIGFIAEDVAKKFKNGATFDQNKQPDGWDIRYMFPAALKLIQEQHNEIETLKEQFETLQQFIKEALS